MSELRKWCTEVSSNCVERSWHLDQILTDMWPQLYHKWSSLSLPQPSVCTKTPDQCLPSNNQIIAFTHHWTKMHPCDNISITRALEITCLMSVLSSSAECSLYISGKRSILISFAPISSVFPIRTEARFHLLISFAKKVPNPVGAHHFNIQPSQSCAEEIRQRFLVCIGSAFKNISNCPAHLIISFMFICV